MKSSCLLFSVCCILALACTQQASNPLHLDGTEVDWHKDQAPFYHGVASGDPLTDRVIIWSRVTPESAGDIEVRWEVSKDSDFENVIQSGIFITGEGQDYTIKVDVTGLEPASNYYYRFSSGKKYSPVGRTKTLSDGNIDHVNLGVVSCSNLEFGYFSAYNGMENEDLDAILHLGDYIYEYAPYTYGDSSFVRKHLPAKEIITLQDYRTRYAQYRLDQGLQKAHGRHPFITIWDDHEISNNAYKSGAQNHQADDGDYLTRKAIARQVYYEWMPVRDNQDHLYRKFQFGNLVDLIMLDERYEGREAPPEENAAANETRTMLGQEQLDWFKSELNNSTSKWKVIGNQVIFSPCNLQLVRPETPLNLDAWDGYGYERDHIIDILNENNISNTIIVTGDTHSSWAFEVPADITKYTANESTVAVEIGTTSITSGNWNERSSDADVIKAEKAIRLSNPHLKYVEGRNHGYVILRITPDVSIAEWHYSHDIQKKDAECYLAKEVTIQNNKILSEKSK